MRNEVDEWNSLYDGLNKTLKQAGDLVNYADYITEQAEKVETALGVEVKVSRYHYSRIRCPVYSEADNRVDL